MQVSRLRDFGGDHRAGFADARVAQPVLSVGNVCLVFQYIGGCGYAQAATLTTTGGALVVVFQVIGSRPMRARTTSESAS